MSWFERLRRAWESTRHDDLDPGCVTLGGPTTDDEELPYVVLFARALALPAGRRRNRKVLQLAAAYRTLFGGSS